MFPLSDYFPEQQLANQCLSCLDTDNLHDLRFVSKSWDGYLLDPKNSEIWSGKSKPLHAPKPMNWMNPFCWASNREYLFSTPKRYSGSPFLGFYQPFYGYHTCVDFYISFHRDNPVNLYQRQFILQFWVSLLPSLVLLFADLYFGLQDSAFSVGLHPLALLVGWFLAFAYVYCLVKVSFVQTYEEFGPRMEFIYLMLCPLLPLYTFNSGYIILTMSWPWIIGLLQDPLNDLLSAWPGGGTSYRDQQTFLFEFLWILGVGMTSVNHPWIVFTLLVILMLAQRKHPNEILIDAWRFWPFRGNLATLLVACPLSYLFNGGASFHYVFGVCLPMPLACLCIPTVNKAREACRDRAKENVWLINYYVICHFFLCLVLCVGGASGSYSPPGEEDTTQERRITMLLMGFIALFLTPMIKKKKPNM